MGHLTNSRAGDVESCELKTRDVGGLVEVGRWDETQTRHEYVQDMRRRHPLPPKVYRKHLTVRTHASRYLSDPATMSLLGVLEFTSFPPVFTSCTTTPTPLTGIAFRVVLMSIAVCPKCAPPLFFVMLENCACTPDLLAWYVFEVELLVSVRDRVGERRDLAHSCRAGGQVHLHQVNISRCIS